MLNRIFKVAKPIDTITLESKILTFTFMDGWGIFHDDKNVGIWVDHFYLGSNLFKNVAYFMCYLHSINLYLFFIIFALDDKTEDIKVQEHVDLALLLVGENIYQVFQCFIVCNIIL